jgi:hypothetical protein
MWLVNLPRSPEVDLVHWEQFCVNGTSACCGLDRAFLCLVISST